MANFQNGKIYSIRSHQTNKIYIGSTTQPLHKRFHQHKHPSNKSTSRAIMQFDDAYIELVENYPCTDKNELYRREGEIIRTRDCVNKQIAGRTDAEYYEDHKTEIKQYYEAHKEQKKQYYEDNKESIKQYSRQYEKTHTEDQKRDKRQYMKQYNKQYKQTHKKTRTCSCGGKFNDGSTSDRNKHYGSKHHIEFDRLHSLLVPEDSNDE